MPHFRIEEGIEMSQPSRQICTGSLSPADVSPLLLVIATILAGSALAESVGLPPGFSDYQHRRLLAPTPAERRTEVRGGIYIYDGIPVHLVDKALDREFERIDNMMFIRIRDLPATGAGPAEEDDDSDEECD